MTDRNLASQTVIAAERDFHNRRFEAGDSRQAQLKYYWAVEAGARRFADRVATLSAGADVLELGCGLETRGPELASRACSFLGIDISDLAIRRVAAACDAPNVSYRVMDAMALTLPDASLDLVYGSGIVHHLDTARCLDEVKRVLRPGGSAVFWEPLGHNPFINAYRRLTPDARTPDEHPLLARDLRSMRERFRVARFELSGLTTIAAVPMRGTAAGTWMRKALSAVDAALVRIPGVQLLAWYALIHLET